MSVQLGRRPSVRVFAVLVPLLCFAASASADQPGRGDQSPIRNAPEEPQDVKELQVPPPAYPRNSDLAEFKLRNPTSNRFFIDTSSITVSKDGIIRFVMVIRTSGDEINVRFSGLRCSSREWKDYAFTSSDKSWKANPNAEWQRIRELRYNNYEDTLYGDYFCLDGVFSSKPVGDAAKLAKLLRNPPKPDNTIPFRKN